MSPVVIICPLTILRLGFLSAVLQKSRGPCPESSGQEASAPNPLPGSPHLQAPNICITPIRRLTYVLPPPLPTALHSRDLRQPTREDLPQVHREVREQQRQRISRASCYFADPAPSVSLSLSRTATNSRDFASGKMSSSTST